MNYTTAQRKQWAKSAARTSMLDAARKHGVSTSAVRNAMRQFGVTPRRAGAPGAYTELQKARAIVLVRKGEDGPTIHQRTGIPAKYAREIARKFERKLN